ADFSWAFRKTDQQQPLIYRMPNDDLPPFRKGMLFIVKDPCQRVIKYCTSLIKAHLVVDLIRSGFMIIPFKAIAHFAHPLLYVFLTYGCKGILPCQLHPGSNRASA